jgi:hypothetical protein
MPLLKLPRARWRVYMKPPPHNLACPQIHTDSPWNAIEPSFGQPRQLDLGPMYPRLNLRFWQRGSTQRGERRQVKSGNGCLGGCEPNRDPPIDTSMVWCMNTIARAGFSEGALLHLRRT